VTKSRRGENGEWGEEGRENRTRRYENQERVIDEMEEKGSKKTLEKKKESICEGLIAYELLLRLFSFSNRD
jgi:hypothetical protein